MAVAWFLCPYKRRGTFPVERYCAVDDFSPQIAADGGAWLETEVLGNQAVVKVRASAATLTAIAGAVGVTRIPLSRLDDNLSTLSQAQRNNLKQILLDAGYSVSEFNTRFPSGINSVTLREVLVFLASRRLRPRYDAGTDQIVLDGAFDSCVPVADVDAAVGDA